ncbi:MAG: ATPase domain-containing protein [Anaerolineales bacterium]
MLFWDRFRQLETLLKAVKMLRHESPGMDLRLVCVDSLNVFGEHLLDREQIFRVFDLFKRYQTIGVFTLEARPGEEGVPGNKLHPNTIEYMADVVIALHATDDDGYFVRHIEVEKSRYQRQTYGRHPFKIAPAEGKINALDVFPSLHYLLSTIETREPSKKEFNFGIKDFNKILKEKLKRNSVVLLEGPQGTFKSTLAMNFLISGLASGDNVLLINLQNAGVFHPDIPHVEQVQVLHAEGSRTEPVDLKKLSKDELLESQLKKELDPTKVDTRIWKYPDIHHQDRYIVELAFRSGAILAEEFMDILRKFFELESPESSGSDSADERSSWRNTINRVVLDDVGSIGVSYPLLRHSRTGGDLFLPTLVNLIRNYDMDLVITGTTGDLSEANEAVNRARSLADTTVACRFCDIFGDRYVTLSGEGLIAGTVEQPDRREPVPGILRLKEKNIFNLDLEFLQGLVGFDTGNIHRPGLALYLLETTGRHRSYNEEIEKILRFAFACPAKEPGRRSEDFTASKVQVVTFDTMMAEPMYDSLSVMGNAPIDQTIVCMFDDFWMEGKSVPQKRQSGDEWKKRNTEEYMVPLMQLPAGKEPTEKKEFIVPLERKNGKTLEKVEFLYPYFANVLLLAYRIDAPGEASFVRDSQAVGWHAIWKYLQANREEDIEGLDYVEFSYETQSCIMLDLLSRKLKKIPFDDPSRALSRLFRDTKLRSELRALKQLLVTPVRKEGMYKTKETREEEKKIRGESFGLRDNAAVYLCWYTQLRELIFRYPHLAGKLGICALPGGGVMGNMYLGIMKGSVSVRFGGKVIEMLCNKEEEYKRFLYGIGIPTRSSFFTKDWKNGYAWPGSKVRLEKLMAIHKKARERPSIPDYKKLRRYLVTLFDQALT